MDNARLLEAIRSLLALTYKEAEGEARAGPAWLHDQTLVAIDKLRELEAACVAGALRLGPGFSFREHLGESWVELEGEVYDLAESLDAELQGIARDA